MDAEWEGPEWALFYRRWAEFCRVIRYDPRGSGSSEPVPLDALPRWGSSAAELLAVMMPSAPSAPRFCLQVKSSCRLTCPGDPSAAIGQHPPLETCSSSVPIRGVRSRRGELRRRLAAL